MVARALTNEPE